MAQPPLSVAIRQLEQELGTEPFVRTTREVQLTDAGQAFLDGVQRMLTELEHAESDARRSAAGELGTLSVAFSWSARFEILPELGQAFRTNHPDVELRTEQMWNAKMPQALLSGEIDVAISLCPERVMSVPLPDHSAGASSRRVWRRMYCLSSSRVHTA